jgi:hypothetical protein
MAAPESRGGFLRDDVIHARNALVNGGGLMRVLFAAWQLHFISVSDACPPFDDRFRLPSLSSVFSPKLEEREATKRDYESRTHKVLS